MKKVATRLKNREEVKYYYKEDKKEPQDLYIPPPHDFIIEIYL